MVALPFDVLPPPANMSFGDIAVALFRQTSATVVHALVSALPATIVRVSSYARMSFTTWP